MASELGSLDVGASDAREADRLHALRALDILDSPPEGTFDDLVKMLSMTFGAPISLVSLVDEDRQWFKAKVGLDAESTGRDVSFCSVAIRRPDEILVVEDTLLDPRFRENGLVTGDPKIRFYAGAPIVDEDDHALGTVCVIDRQPRSLTPEQRELLRLAARHAGQLLHGRKAQRELAAVVCDLAESNLDKAGLVEHLERKTSTLEQLVRALCHDFSSPLHAIKHLAEWALEDLERGTPESAKPHVSQILKRTSRLDEMQRGLLDYLRDPESPLAVPIDLQELLTGIVALYDHKMAVRLEVESPGTFRSVRPLLVTIFLNLVANSIKYCGSDQVAISVRRQASESGTEIHFRDDGPGLPPRALERIFEPFARLDPHGTILGTGLGLSVARKASETLGGSIEARPSETGAHFVLFLP